MDVYFHTEFQFLLEEANTLITDDGSWHACAKAKKLLQKAL